MNSICAGDGIFYNHFTYKSITDSNIASYVHSYNVYYYSGGIGLAGTGDAVQSAQLNSTQDSHEIVADATRQFGENVGDAIEGYRDDANAAGNFLSKGLYYIEHSTEAGKFDIISFVMSI